MCLLTTSSMSSPIRLAHWNGYPHIVPLAMELTSRAHAGTSEPIPRRPSCHRRNSQLREHPAEVQQVLGWTIDTRRLTVSLPKSKFDMWTDDIRQIQRARRSSTELLATIEGRLNHAASVLPMARHFLTRLRKLKNHHSNGESTLRQADGRSDRRSALVDETSGYNTPGSVH
jgi:hypothetical protein